MTVRHFTLLAATTVTATLLLAATATAAIFRGDTSQGFQGTIRTDGEGVPTRFWLKKYTVDCGQGFFFRDLGAGSVPPFDRANAQELFDRGPRYESQGSNGETFSALTSVRAQSSRGGDLWRGTFRSQVDVLRGGQQVDSCNGKIRFKLRRRG